MDLTLALKAIILGIVEGLTEFLPISSTGHLILTADLLNFTGDKVVVFEIAIQCGALLAVMWEYRVRMMEVISGLPRQAAAQRFTWKLLVAFLPAVILGLLFGKQIQAVLFTPVVVAAGFIVGGLAILWVERAKHAGRIVERVCTVDEMTVMDALKIGLIQALALIPGTSRSGASIIGGLWVGLSRTASTEFSFFLAIPTLLGATVYSLYGHRDLLSMADLPLFTVGTVSAAISGFVCVRWLLRYIGHHDFTAFAWYRIAFGLVVLGTAYSGVVDWSQ